MANFHFWFRQIGPLFFLNQKMKIISKIFLKNVVLMYAPLISYFGKLYIRRFLEFFAGCSIGIGVGHDLVESLWFIA